MKKAIEGGLLMKVLFVANQYQIGGATKSLLCLMKQLKEIYQVEPVVLIPNDGYLLDMCKQEKIKYLYTIQLLLKK